MPTDPLTELAITLKEACKLFPTKRRGKKPHVSRVYRYTKQGLKGVVLESIQCGATRCTTAEAVARFFVRLTEKSKLTNHWLDRKVIAPKLSKDSVTKELDEIGL